MHHLVTLLPMVLFSSMVLQACLATGRPAKRQASLYDVKSTQRNEISNILNNLQNDVSIPGNVSEQFATACELTEAYYLVRAQNESGIVSTANQSLVDDLVVHTTELCKQVIFSVWLLHHNNAFASNISCLQANDNPLSFFLPFS